MPVKTGWRNMGANIVMHRDVRRQTANTYHHERGPSVGARWLSNLIVFANGENRTVRDTILGGFPALRLELEHRRSRC